MFPSNHFPTSAKDRQDEQVVPWKIYPVVTITWSAADD